MRSLIYPTPDVEIGVAPMPFEEIALRIDEGTRVVGWHRPLPLRQGGPTLLYLHGNGENLETMKRAGLFERLTALEVPVLAIDYPGYGRSTGTPSEESLKRTGKQALLWLAKRYPGMSVVPCGWSLGAAVAVHLAATQDSAVGGVVALSPWASLQEVAAEHFPRWLVSAGLREKYDSLGAGPLVASPAVVAHGTEDRVIAIEQGRRLAASVAGARWVPVEGAGHNDLPSFPVVWQEIDDLLSGLRLPSGV